MTCGGLCPGLNNVIRSATLELIFNYGVKRVLGIRYGFLGMNPQEGKPPIELTPEYVERIHYLGGTVWGVRAGPQPPEVMVDFLEQEKIDILLCVGGDGTQRGSQAIQQEVQRRGLSKTVVGIPKTIDNDIAYVTSTFGYATALSKAEEVLRAAHTEARNAVNGIGLVRLWGADAGFIAAAPHWSARRRISYSCPKSPSRWMASMDSWLPWNGVFSSGHMRWWWSPRAHGQHLFNPSAEGCVRQPDSRGHWPVPARSHSAVFRPP